MDSEAYPNITKAISVPVYNEDINVLNELQELLAKSQRGQKKIEAIIEKMDSYINNKASRKLDLKKEINSAVDSRTQTLLDFQKKLYKGMLRKDEKIEERLHTQKKLLEEIQVNTTEIVQDVRTEESKLTEYKELTESVENKVNNLKKHIESIATEVLEISARTETESNQTIQTEFTEIHNNIEKLLAYLYIKDRKKEPIVLRGTCSPGGN